MREFKVIALSVGALGNKIFNSGEIVNESNFPEGNAEQLVKQGFLVPVDSETENDSNEHSSEISEASTAKELREALSLKNIEFKANASKVELFALWGKTLADEANLQVANESLNTSSEISEASTDKESENK